MSIPYRTHTHINALGAILLLRFLPVLPYRTLLHAKYTGITITTKVKVCFVEHANCLLGQVYIYSNRLSEKHLIIYNDAENHFQKLHSVAIASRDHLQ
jgi:hypothetical protein